MSMAIADRRAQRANTGVRANTGARTTPRQGTVDVQRMRGSGRPAPVRRVAPRSVRQEPNASSLAQRVVVDRSARWGSDPRQSAAARRRRRASSARLRGRILLFAATILTLVGLVVAFGQLAGASDTSGPESATATVTVQSGDSLWSLATAAERSADPRETVERIRELNGLDDSVIVPGQRLVVPVGA